MLLLGNVNCFLKLSPLRRLLKGGSPPKDVRKWILCRASWCFWNGGVGAWPRGGSASGGLRQNEKGAGWAHPVGAHCNTASLAGAWKRVPPRACLPLTESSSSWLIERGSGQSSFMDEMQSEEEREVKDDSQVRGGGWWVMQCTGKRRMSAIWSSLYLKCPLDPRISGSGFEPSGPAWRERFRSRWHVACNEVIGVNKIVWRVTRSGSKWNSGEIWKQTPRQIWTIVCICLE